MISNLESLLVMPRPARRAWAWEQLTRGEWLIEALRQAVGTGQVAPVGDWVSTWQAYVACQNGFTQRQWQVVQALLTCARLALSGEAPDSQPWLPDLGTAWAQDVIAILHGQPRPVAQTESIGVLLVSNGGAVARLTLSQLAGAGQAQLYPDPVTLSFVYRDEAFRQAEQQAVAYIRRQGLWPVGAGVDIRWQLVRQDGQPLTRLAGGSAGGAFALALARLLVREP